MGPGAPAAALAAALLAGTAWRRATAHAAGAAAAAAGAAAGLHAAEEASAAAGSRRGLLPGHLQFNVSACAGYASDKDICLHVDMASRDKDEVICACKAYYPKPHATPVVSELFKPPQSQVHFCNSTQACDIYISDDIQPGFLYFSFCACLHPGHWWDLRQFLDVRPQCNQTSGACGVEVSMQRKGLYHNKLGYQGLGSVVVLLTYVIWSYVFERSQGAARLVHETGMAALVGVAIGIVFKRESGAFLTWFNYDLFSYILLPMVIFAAGFNLQHKSFWRYLPFMLSLGVLGTCLMFAFIFAGSTIRFKSHSGDTLQLDVRHRMVMASVLSSTDTVAPMAFLPADVFPRLYALVFGEGVLNDVVSILLSTAAASSDGASAALAVNIVVLFLASGVMGVACGLGMSYLFRRVEWFQTGEPLKPCALLLLGNYACYMLVEMWGLSSIFALFVSSLVCGHYAKHSLADRGAFAAELAEFLAYVAEAFVFGYFGLTSVGYLQDPKTVSPSLICFYIGCIFMSRVVAVALLALPLRCCWYRRGSAALPKRELCIVALAGCMRGTIAFALVLRATPAPEMQLPEDRLLITTVLGIVMVNAIVFGALFPVAMQLLGLVPLPDVPQGAVEGAGDRIGEGGAHGRWKRLDDRYLKPLFRKPENPRSRHPAEAMAETVVPRRQQLWPMARQQSGESGPAAASERRGRRQSNASWPGAGPAGPVSAFEIGRL